MSDTVHSDHLKWWETSWNHLRYFQCTSASFFLILRTTRVKNGSSYPTVPYTHFFFFKITFSSEFKCTVHLTIQFFFVSFFCFRRNNNFKKISQFRLFLSDWRVYSLQFRFSIFINSKLWEKSQDYERKSHLFNFSIVSSLSSTKNFICIWEQFWGSKTA